jgi:hypothetical protein
VCKICWSNGPTEQDVIEIEGNLHLWILDKDTYGTDLTDFMVEFSRYVSSGDDHWKAWGHFGMLRAWLSSDPRGRFAWARHPASPRDTIAGGQWTFGPTNRVYGGV